MKQHEIIIDKANQSKFKESLDAIDSYVLKKIQILNEHHKAQEMTTLKGELQVLEKENNERMKKNISELEAKMNQLQEAKVKESFDAIDSHVLKKIKILKEHEKVQEMTALKNEVITLINDNNKSMKKNMSELEVKMTQLQEAKVKVEELLQQLEDRSKYIERLLEDVSTLEGRLTKPSKHNQ